MAKPAQEYLRGIEVNEWYAGVLGEARELVEADEVDTLVTGLGSEAYARAGRWRWDLGRNSQTGLHKARAEFRRAWRQGSINSEHLQALEAGPGEPEGISGELYWCLVAAQPREYADASLYWVRLAGLYRKAQGAHRCA